MICLNYLKLKLNEKTTLKYESNKNLKQKIITREYK